MSTEFCTLLEDGSEREVAKSIWTLFQESIKGKTVLLEQLRQRAALAPVILPNKIDSDSDSESGATTDEEESTADKDGNVEMVLE